MTVHEDSIRHERALRRARAKLRVYQHAASYIIVNVLLVAIDLSRRGDTWFQWVLGSWAILLTLHVLHAFRDDGTIPERLTERSMRQETSGEE